MNAGDSVVRQVFMATNVIRHIIAAPAITRKIFSETTPEEAMALKAAYAVLGKLYIDCDGRLTKEFVE